MPSEKRQTKNQTPKPHFVLVQVFEPYYDKNVASVTLSLSQGPSKAPVPLPLDKN